MQKVAKKKSFGILLRVLILHTRRRDELLNGVRRISYFLGFRTSVLASPLHSCRIRLSFLFILTLLCWFCLHFCSLQFILFYPELFLFLLFFVFSFFLACFHQSNSIASEIEIPPLSTTPAPPSPLIPNKIRRDNKSP